MSKTKILAGIAAMAFGAMLFAPGSAEARDRANAQATNKQDLAQYEWSSHRRRYRHRHHHVRRYYAPSYSYYGSPYYGPRYGYYAPYRGYGYYGPRAGIGIGPFGLGVGFGW